MSGLHCLARMFQTVHCSPYHHQILDIVPDAVHQRVPMFVGSKREVEYLESFTKNK